MKNFYVCLLTIFLSCFFASLIQSSFGSVNIQTVKIPTQNGQWVVADLYKPSSASKDSPAPVVIIIPGFQRSKETLSNIAIELSRRGIVSISIDPYAQGNSSSSMSTKAATSEGYGMFAIVDFIYETNILNYIDKKKIGATGHSAGGLAAMRGAQYFGGQVENSKNKSKLHSAFISGMIRMGFKSKDIKKINVLEVFQSHGFSTFGPLRGPSGAVLARPGPIWEPKWTPKGTLKLHKNCSKTEPEKGPKMDQQMVPKSY